MVYVSDFGFYIDKHEVTNAQDVGFVAARGHRAPDSVNRGSANWNTWQNGRFPPGMGNHPVVGVSFGDARAYCAWAGKRLPTDEEWEQACEGTDGRAYPWGNETPNSHLANHDEDVGKTTEVGKYPSGVSPYGALDMSGNVWEWIGSSSGSNCVICGGAGTMLRSTCGALFATTVFLTVGATTLVFVARGINSTLIPLLPQAGGRANQ